MKKLLIIFGIAMLFLSSCSNDAEIKQKLAGEWIMMDNNPQTKEPLHYIFKDNGHYERYWTNQEKDQQQGIWSIKNGKLDIYILGVPMTYKYIINGNILTLKGIKYKKVE